MCKSSLSADDVEYRKGDAPTAVRRSWNRAGRREGRVVTAARAGLRIIDGIVGWVTDRAVADPLQRLAWTEPNPSAATLSPRPSQRRRSAGGIPPRWRRHPTTAAALKLSRWCHNYCVTRRNAMARAECMRAHHRHLGHRATPRYTPSWDCKSVDSHRARHLGQHCYVATASSAAS